MNEPATDPALELKGCTQCFVTASGDTYTAVRGIDLTVKQGEFVSIVGPTGCGKSTILNMAAGLLPPTEGTVKSFGAEIRKGVNRRAAYMFQQDALLPWKTVIDNVAMGPILKGVKKKEATKDAEGWLRTVGLSAFREYYPQQLSGGMRKRTAVAQAWINDPDIFLMDEPFSALDVQTRQLMENELLALWQGSNKAVVFITHDLEEAISLSDTVVIFGAGPASEIIGSHRIDLDRPRDLMNIRTDPKFTDVYSTIWDQLREEVLLSYEQQQHI